MAKGRLRTGNSEHFRWAGTREVGFEALQNGLACGESLISFCSGQIAGILPKSRLRRPQHYRAGEAVYRVVESIATNLP